jgi:hypothetical protein
MEKLYSERQVRSLVKKEREKAVTAVLDLMYALKHIKGKPTLKDLIKLAKRIRKVPAVNYDQP